MHLDGLQQNIHYSRKAWSHLLPFRTRCSSLLDIATLKYDLLDKTLVVSYLKNGVLQSEMKEVGMEPLDHKSDITSRFISLWIVATVFEVLKWPSNSQWEKNENREHLLSKENCSINGALSVYWSTTNIMLKLKGNSAENKSKKHLTSWQGN